MTIIIILAILIRFRLLRPVPKKGMNQLFIFFESLPSELKKELGKLIHENQCINYIDFSRKVHKCFKEHNLSKRSISSKREDVQFIVHARRIGIIRAAKQGRREKIYSGDAFHEFVIQRKYFDVVDEFQKKYQFKILGVLAVQLKAKSISEVEDLINMVPLVDKIYEDFYPY